MRTFWKKHKRSVFLLIALLCVWVQCAALLTISLERSMATKSVIIKAASIIVTGIQIPLFFIAIFKYNMRAKKIREHLGSKGMGMTTETAIVRKKVVCEGYRDAKVFLFWLICEGCDRVANDDIAYYAFTHNERGRRYIGYKDNTNLITYISKDFWKESGLGVWTWKFMEDGFIFQSTDEISVNAAYILSSNDIIFSQCVPPSCSFFDFQSWLESNYE